MGQLMGPLFGTTIQMVAMVTTESKQISYKYSIVYISFSYNKQNKAMVINISYHAESYSIRLCKYILHIDPGLLHLKKCVAIVTDVVYIQNTHIF